MVVMAIIIFWIGVVIVGYTYTGYGIAILLLSKLKKSSSRLRESMQPELPEVTMLIAAYNEEPFIEEKIKNTLSLDYPTEKLSVFIVTDGSTDQTPLLVKKFHAVRLFHEPGRKGKIHAVNRVMKHVSTPIVIFSDANAILNKEAVRKIVRHYENPEVGGVAGEKRIFQKSHDNASGSGEGLYWKYESFLKRMDSEVYSIVGAAGELFSIRTELYEPPAENMIIEDFYMSLRIAERGFRFLYEPGAYAMETASSNVDEEWKRKVRICAGGFQAMARLTGLLNPMKHGILTFQYVSHRVLRWTLAPLFLPLIFLASAFLSFKAYPFYTLALVAQIAFYFWALLGHRLRDRNISIKGFFVPYYFVVMNLSVYAGFIRYCRGKQSVVWERAQRATMTSAS